MIDVVEVKNEIKKGNLTVSVRNGHVLLADKRSGECVSLALLKVYSDGEWKNIGDEVRI